MRIEDHWHDGVEYFVSFETSKGVIISRRLILPTDVSQKKVEKIIKQNFHSVKKVIEIDEIADVLIMK